MNFSPFRWFSRSEVSSEGKAALTPDPDAPVPVAKPEQVPASSLGYVVFTQPPMSPYAYASHCYEKSADSVLAQELKRQGPEAFMLVAADEKSVLVQTQEYLCKLDREGIQEISLHPVLPAKGSGMVMLFFEIAQKGQIESHDFLMCAVYSEELQEWCEKKGREVAALLNVPFQVSCPSHDC
ncbi:hypothetical protein WJU23_02110 [Prosthecobacter sp. SYSU 5D2]|uniref:hypothetical protein n=1 Tax=Prosthecobacter sp. SYSU 5D2 TaxID=3134134 RepID=UPI0031FEC56B